MSRNFSQRMTKWLTVVGATTAGLGLVPGLMLFAQAAPVTFSTDTTVTLANGISLTVVSGSTADSVTVNATANTVAVTTSGSQEFTLKSSSGNYALTHDGTSIGSSCTFVGAFVQLTVSGERSLTFSPTTSVTCTQGTGSGGGGGGSSAPAVVVTPVVTPTVPVTPTTPVTTPVVPAVTPVVPATPTTPVTPAVTLPAAASPVAVLIHDPAKYEELLAALGTASKPAEFAKYKALVKSDALAFKVGMTDAQQTAVANFVTYGASKETVKLGAGERRAVVRDYMETVGRTDVIWDDVQRMATGQKLINRNLANERAQVDRVLANFKRITGKQAPNFKNPAEDLAWNTMMYRIRFTRDLALEKQGIVEFKAIYGRNPSTPMEWSIVRALGYALK